MEQSSDAKRTCGTCDACCRVFEIAEVKKRGEGLCLLHQAGLGCTRYASRPKTCRAYRCEWIDGYGDTDFRPDLLGVLTDTVSFFLQNRKFKKARFKELRPHALEQDQVKEAMEKYHENGYIIVIHRYGCEEHIFPQLLSHPNIDSLEALLIIEA